MTRDSIDERLDQLLKTVFHSLEGTSKRQEILNTILNDIPLRRRLFERASRQQDLKERRKQRQLVTWVMQQSGRIWRAWSVSEEVYQEALSRTWLWFWQKFDQYEPDTSSFIEWFNNKLKFIIRDITREIIKDSLHTHQPFKQEDADNHERNWIKNIAEKYPNPMDWVDASSLLERIHKWVEREQKNLRNKYVSNRPEVHCAFLILSRLPLEDKESLQFQDGKDWEQLLRELQDAGEPDLSVKKIQRCYNEKCLPCLRKFLESEGYSIPKKSKSASFPKINA